MKPYMNHNGVEIWHCDAFWFFGYEERKFDCCITDPPYGSTNLPWDRWQRGWIYCAFDNIKSTGSLWLFAAMKTLIEQASELTDGNTRIAQDIVWEKQNGTGFHADRFRRVHEHVVQLYRGKWSNVYRSPIYTYDAKKRKVTRQGNPKHFNRCGPSTYETEAGGKRLERSVLRIRNEHHRAVHPTQKPIELLTKLIVYSSPFGGVVFDPFAGAGTTGVAAVMAGRRAVLVEQDERYCEIAAMRIQAL